MSTRSKIAAALLLLGLATVARADGLSTSVTPQLGGGIGGFDGGISFKAITQAVTGCSGTGLIFSVACNSQYVGILQ